MAVTLDSAALRASVNGLDKADVAVADRLLAVVIALVEGEGPDAPSSIQNEAAIRAAAWLFQSQTSVGQLSTENRPHASSSIRASGARALLSPWIERTL